MTCMDVWSGQKSCEVTGLKVSVSEMLASTGFVRLEACTFFILCLLLICGPSALLHSNGGLESEGAVVAEDCLVPRRIIHKQSH